METIESESLNLYTNDSRYRDVVTPTRNGFEESLKKKKKVASLKMVRMNWELVLSVKPSALTDQEIEDLFPMVVSCEVESVENIHNLKALMKLSQEMLQHKDNQVDTLYITELLSFLITNDLFLIIVGRVSSVGVR